MVAVANVSLVARLGISIQSEPRTLVVADCDALSRLPALAPCSQSCIAGLNSALLLAGGVARRPSGTGAVLKLTAACAARWVLGVAPSAERNITTWRKWLASPTGVRVVCSS